MPRCDRCERPASRSKTWNFNGGHTTIWYCKDHLQSNQERQKNKMIFPK